LQIPFWKNDVVQKVLAHADQRDAIDTFNMGLGWVAIVSPEQADTAVKCGSGAVIIGQMHSTPEVSVEVLKA
jgi:phosphoribosylformylglycinamidine cyclo-ligase